MTDIVNKYLAPGRHTAAEVKAAYLAACNAGEGTAFREAVEAKSARHKALMAQAITVKATEIKGQYAAWAKGLRVVVGDTELMRALVADENGRVAAING